MPFCRPCLAAIQLTGLPALSPWACKSDRLKAFGLALALLTLAILTTAALPTQAQQHHGHSQVAQARVYPEFRSRFGVIHWVRDQMPLKVYISPGLTLDSIMDPHLGAPVANTDNLANWPNLVAQVVDNPEQFQALRPAEGYVDGHYQAVYEGILSWKQFEREGLVSFEITQDPAEADIYVFYTHHFVTKNGMALFAGDIRGYTSKTNFPYKPILAGGQADFKPVVIILRTTDGQGRPMALGRLKAAATHEFGHALGIEGHSTDPGDLMSLYYGRGVISPNDAATLRYLYHLQPDLIP
jgi:predicted Zn-dependent protease